jgi:hypothetical protein
MDGPKITFSKENAQILKKKMIDDSYLENNLGVKKATFLRRFAKKLLTEGVRYNLRQFDLTSEDKHRRNSVNDIVFWIESTSRF